MDIADKAEQDAGLVKDEEDYNGNNMCAGGFVMLITMRRV